MTTKDKITSELQEKIYRLKFDISYNQSLIPGLQERIEQAKNDLEAAKEKLDAKSEQKEKSHKREVREELKKLGFEFATANKVYNGFVAAVKMVQDNISQNEDQVSSLESKLAFLQTYEA